MRFYLPPPVRAMRLITRFRREDYLFSIICTMRARLVVDGVCEPLKAADQPGIRTPEYFDDGLGSSPLFGGDYAPYKPRTDVTLAGSGYVPGKRGAPSLNVTLGVDGWRKSLTLVGDRMWVRAVEVELSPPTPFEHMQLRLENAFGGVGSSSNPWGKGLGELGKAIGSVLPAANIHPRDEHHVRWDEADEIPAGFGPLPEDTMPRIALRGTYDEQWQYKRSPLPPKDFDWGFYNVAPRDQQFFPYLTGKETLFFENLRPESPSFSCALPGLRLRVLLRRSLPDAGEARIEEVRAVLDSVHVDTETMTVDLAWRAVSRTFDKEGADISHCYVATEPLSEEAGPLSQHVRRFQTFLAPPPPPPPPPPPESAPEAPEVDESELLTDMKAMFEDAPLSPELKAKVGAARTRDEIENALLDELRRAVAAASRQ